MSYLAHLAEFQCQRCLKCCTNPGYIYVNQEEITRLSSFLGIPQEEFVNEYCDLIEKPRLTLKTHPDGTCILLNGKNCRVHPEKPGQCRDFPTRWRTQDALGYCEGLINLAAIYGT